MQRLTIFGIAINRRGTVVRSKHVTPGEGEMVLGISPFSHTSCLHLLPTGKDPETHTSGECLNPNSVQMTLSLHFIRRLSSSHFRLTLKMTTVDMKTKTLAGGWHKTMDGASDNKVYDKVVDQDINAGTSERVDSTVSSGSPLSRFHTSILNSIDKEPPPPHLKRQSHAASTRNSEQSLLSPSQRMESKDDSAPSGGDNRLRPKNRMAVKRKRSFGSISNSSGDPQPQTNHYGDNSGLAAAATSSFLSTATAELSSSASRLLFNNGNQRSTRRRSSLFGDLNSSRSSAIDFGNKKNSIKSLFTFGKPKATDAVADAAASAKEAASSIGRPSGSTLGRNIDDQSSPSRRPAGNSANRDWSSKNFPPFSPPSSTSSKPSLFGAVMQKFGSSGLSDSVSCIGDSRTEFFSNMSTPTKSRAPPENDNSKVSISRRSSGVVRRTATSSLGTPTASLPVSNSANSRAASSSIATAWASFSPHGNSILNMVKGVVMNSPFRFQSPEKKKRRKNNDTSSTPSSSSPRQKIKRRRLNLDLDATSKYSPTIPKQQHGIGSLSSASPAILGSPSASSRTPIRLKKRRFDLDEWHEATLIQATGGNKVCNEHNGIFCGMSLVDWSFKERIRLECQPAACATAAMMSRQWESATSYWQHPATPLPASILLLLEQEQSNTQSPDQHRTSLTTDMFATKSQPAKSAPQKLQRTQSTSSVTSRQSGKRSSGNSISKNKPIDNTKAKGKKSGSGLTGDDLKVSKTGSRSKRQQALAARLVRSVKGPHAKLGRRGLGSKSSFATGDDLAAASSFLVQRQRDWQEAFRSVYQKWRSQFEEIAATSSISKLHLNNAWMDCYFYCVARDHVVLFRLSNPQRGTNGTIEDGCKVPTPEVIISYASPALEERLIQMGIEKVESLAPNITQLMGTDTQESVLSPIDKGTQLKRPDAGGTLLSPMSPTLVQAELEALRKAQVHGETAGADVSVKIRKGNNENSNSNKGPDAGDICTGPLLLSGLDDVGAFFEIYFNTQGRLATFIGEASKVNTQATTKPRTLQQPQDVPLILCRSLGPFANATQKSLSVFPAESPTERKENDGNGVNRNRSSYAAFEIEGDSVILPCSLRSMVGIMTSELIAHSQLSGLAGSESNNHKQHSESVGSHHMILHLSTERPASISFAAVAAKSAKIAAKEKDYSGAWTKTSAWLNHSRESFRDALPAMPGSTKSVENCPPGSVVPLLVWDITRKGEVAYKLEPSSQPVATKLGL